MDRVPDLRLRRYPSWIWYVLVVYAISFLLPQTTHLRGQGWIIFLLGAYYIYVPYCWPWLANPLLWLACWLSRFSKVTAFVLSCLSLVAALTFLLFLLLPEDEEFNLRHTIGPAYWCWTASMAIAVVGSAREWLRTWTRAAVVPLLEYDEPAVSSIPRDPGIQK